MQFDEQTLTELDVAHLLKVSRKTVSRIRESDPDFPRPIKVGASDRYILRDIRDWQQLQKLKARLAELSAPAGTNTDKSGHPKK